MGLRKSKSAAGVATERSRPFSVYRAAKENARRYAEYLEGLEYQYQNGLDSLESYEYTVECSDVDRQVERRLSLFQEYSKADIKRSVEETGFTPSELEGIQQAEAIDIGQGIRNLYFQYTKGRLESPDPSQDPEAWHSDRNRDLFGNFLYGEYMTQLFASDEALTYQQFSEWLGCNAYWRILTRARFRNEMLDEMGTPTPTRREVENFSDRGFHQLRNISKTDYIERMYQHLPGSREAVQKLLEMYGENVREVWDRTRNSDVSPLPGENDWMFLEAEDDPIERAVEAYLVSGNINKASQQAGIGARKLMQALDERGIKRTQKKGRRDV